MQQLPSELITHIFSFVSSLELCRLSRVNTLFSIISNNDNLWNTILKSSPFYYWWDIDELKHNDNYFGKRNEPALSKKQLMRENTMKTLQWAKGHTKNLDALIVGDPTRTFELSDNICVYNNYEHEEGGEEEKEKRTINGTKLNLYISVGEEDDNPGDKHVILIHFYDTNSLYVALLASQRVKRRFANVPFIIAHEPCDCSQELIDQLYKKTQAKEIISLSSPSSISSLFFILLKYAAGQAIRNTPLTSLSHRLSSSLSKRVKTEAEEIHSEIRCDGCKMYPIVGARHRCTRCKRVDLCQRCYENRKTKRSRCVNHEFKKIKLFDVGDFT